MWSFSTILALLSGGVVSLGAAWVSFKNPDKIKALFFFFSFIFLGIIELGYFSLKISFSIPISFWQNFLLSLGLFFFMPLWAGYSFVLGKENYRESLKRGRFWLIFFLCSSLVGLIWQISSPFIFFEKDLSGKLILLFKPISKIWIVTLLTACIAALFNLETTFRSLTGSTKKLWSIPLYLMTLFFGGIIFLLTWVLLYGEIGTFPFIAGAVASLLLFFVLAPFATKSPQISTSARLSRQTVYSSVILVLVGLYFLFIGIIAKIIQLVGGNLNVFISIIAAFFLIILFSVLFLSPTLKKRVKKFVDSSIYSGKYDFRKEWERFSENISSLLDQGELLRMIKDVISSNLNAENYSLFLIDEKGKNFSPAFSSSEFPSEFSFDAQESWLEWVFLNGQPVKTEILFKQVLSESSLGQKLISEELKASLVVPLIAKRNLMGILFLGAKKDKKFYTEEDFVFLNAMAHQSATAILNARMSEALIKSKELESFHRLSTFVIHDLKNAVSMLSLLLQNAQGRLDNPEFQKSALFTISDSVQSMQKLIQKLSSFSVEVELNLCQCDLNALFKKLIEKLKLENFKQIQLETDFGEIPLVVCDQTQIEKVMQNLIVNAIEALPQGGKINIATSSENLSSGSIVKLKVSDTGMGMSAEFIRTKLFQPFQTTKRKGLGIGLFHCKEIVESHQGRIKVESQENVGTTFMVELPVKPQE
jgi:putative PEP-CTERM system histidine kinase